ncbi:MAG: amino acid ABC transporter substrate-binding protein [Caldilineaceae bacterium SB0664_bin_27]|uniref:Amino acid ABC transporter substrate-binding protein n=1 Tax=Caldilineaceae bacterium SB0664_bin_27 TaxID=2605260 RepID=A0A6B0Z0B4_9CHLR|nr:amino acid ABC transporter substrate-binding protein [Caldilineaceae bacterium SB0664_bin_27]
MNEEGVRVERVPPQGETAGAGRQWLVAASHGSRGTAFSVRDSFKRRPLLWLAVSIAALALAGWLILRTGGPAVDGTWLRMQERGSWRVGMDPSFPPFETLDAEGAPVGYDVDLAREIAAEWGLEAEIVAIGYDSLLDALLVDRVDAVISAFPYNARMTKDVHYSPPYFEAGVRLVVGAGAAYEEVGDLEGGTVAVEWGSRGDAIARRLQREGAGFTRLPFESTEKAIEALLSGASNALLIDGVTLRLAQGEGKRIRAVGAVLDEDPYVIAVSIEAPKLQSALLQALAALEEEGRMELLEERWFGQVSGQEE